jgi:hypothetical protein
MRSLPVLTTSIVWFGEIVLFYFVWARMSGNFASAFQIRVAALADVDPKLIFLSAFELTTYLTMFLFPFLLLERWPATRWPVFLVLVAVGALFLLCGREVQPMYAAFHHHVRFPFSANIVNDTNVGPITLTTTYWEPDAPRPHWPDRVWRTIEWLLLIGTLLWVRLVSSRSGEPRPAPFASEIRNFGLIFGALAFVVYVQAFQRQVLDRYFLPCMLGAVIALGARASRLPKLDRWWLALAAALPLCWYTIAGVHDYFRWNDARWDAVKVAEAHGGNPALLDGGYEVNGWLNYDANMRGTIPQGCRGVCRCREGAFYCTDDSYTISMEPRPGYLVLADLPVDWWLAKGPSIVLSRRP